MSPEHTQQCERLLVAARGPRLQRVDDQHAMPGHPCTCPLEVGHAVLVLFVDGNDTSFEPLGRAPRSNEGFLDQLLFELIGVQPIEGPTQLPRDHVPGLRGQRALADARGTYEQDHHASRDSTEHLGDRGPWILVDDQAPTSVTSKRTRLRFDADEGGRFR